MIKTVTIMVLSTLLVAVSCKSLDQSQRDAANISELRNVNEKMATLIAKHEGEREQNNSKLADLADGLTAMNALNETLGDRVAELERSNADMLVAIREIRATADRVDPQTYE